MNPYIAHTAAYSGMLRIESPYSGYPASSTMNNCINPPLIILCVNALYRSKHSFRDHFPHLPYHGVTGIGVCKCKGESCLFNQFLQILCFLNGHGHRLFADKVESVCEEFLCLGIMKCVGCDNRYNSYPFIFRFREFGFYHFIYTFIATVGTDPFFGCKFFASFIIDVEDSTDKFKFIANP